MNKPKIILANLGNRNLRYQGRLHSEWYQAGDTRLDFRAFTQDLLARYEAVAADISPQILPTLLDAKGQEAGLVVLFSSAQPEGFRQDQDTYFAGEILVRKLGACYPHLHVVHYPIEAPVTDGNLLAPAYREALRALREQAPAAGVLLCDAGGTPQQKAALKILLEFMFDRQDIEVYHVAQNAGYTSELRPAPPLAYRRIIDAEQMLGLLQQANYLGALDIFTRLNREAVESPLYHLLKFAHYRSERLTADARDHADPALYPEDWQDQIGLLRAYAAGEPAGKYLPWAQDCLRPEAFFDLCELMALAQLNYWLRRYTQVVMHLSRFMENFLKGVLSQCYDCRFEHSNGKGMHQLLRVAKKLPAVRSYHGKRDIRPSLETMILVCDEVDNAALRRFISGFRALHHRLNPMYSRKEPGEPPYALNQVRNEIAHNGRGVTASLFMGIPRLSHHIGDWAQWLGLPDLNPYDELNALIKKHLE